MPYWRTWRRYRYRPRRRWLRRRYTRRPFQRRLWRRRRRTVRKRKLKKIKIQQWQPQYIRKLKVVGYEPLFLSNAERLTNNFTCYKDSTAPYHFPGGGGFSIMNFTLNALYEKHLVLQNWWTNSNDNMPLIKYNGCTIYLYKEAEFDYLFQYNRAYPMHATLFTYTSTHPQAMLLHKHTKKILCKRNNRNKKPYKKLKILPPTQMYNKWYFQRDIAHVPLLQLMTTAASLDRMFLHSNAISSTVGFTSLDITGMRNHNYTKTSTTGYIPLQNTLLFGVRIWHSIKQLKITDLIFLGNPEDYTEGTAIGDISNITQYATLKNTTAKKIKAAQMEQKYWGNPFDPTFHRLGKLVTTNKTWDEIIAKYNTTTSEPPLTIPDGWFVEKTHFTIECRYNPFADQAVNNKLYLIDLRDKTHEYDWTSAIAVKETLYENLPVWLMLWGYLDYCRKCGELSVVDTNYLLVIYSPYILPKNVNYFVPLDQDFLEGRSPYADQEVVFPSDSLQWHPRVRTQVRTVNMIGSTGPGVIKLPGTNSCEAHMKYVFNFKIGGQPPPMATLTDPDVQPKYITPDNLLQQTSLQSPTTPFEYLLYNFDERRGQITKAAIKRMQKHQETEPTLFPITETTLACPIATSKEKIQTSDTSDSEKEEMSIEEQLLHERKQQKLLRKRIKLLLNRLALE
nr:MAG: ORF1 [TTV-like mini virus]